MSEQNNYYQGDEYDITLNGSLNFSGNECEVDFYEDCSKHSYIRLPNINRGDKPNVPLPSDDVGTFISYRDGYRHRYCFGDESSNPTHQNRGETYYTLSTMFADIKLSNESNINGNYEFLISGTCKKRCGFTGMHIFKIYHEGSPGDPIIDIDTNKIVRDIIERTIKQNKDSCKSKGGSLRRQKRTRYVYFHRGIKIIIINHPRKPKSNRKTKNKNRRKPFRKTIIRNAK